MDIYVMTPDLQTVGVIDVYTSIIWTKRYYACGDFELYMPVGYLDILSIGNYLYRLDDDAVMLIESIAITTDAEAGDFLTVKGRSVECLLARRIVWNQTTFSGTVENLIYRLIRENAISPTDTNRVIPNLVLGASQNYTERIEKQITGDNLLEAISNLCLTYGYGFKITFSGENFVFSLYRGEVKPDVIFSPEFDNLINTSYQRDVSGFANVALVAGEGEGAARVRQAVGTASGLDRSEVYVDARDLSTNAEEPLTAEEYSDVLTARGEEQIAEHTITEGFEGEVEPMGTYQYKSDWYLGDIVSVVNEYGISATPRIVEVIESEDASGYKLIPTFTTWEV